MRMVSIVLSTPTNGIRVYMLLCSELTYLVLIEPKIVINLKFNFLTDTLKKCEA